MHLLCFLWLPLPLTPPPMPLAAFGETFPSFRHMHARTRTSLLSRSIFHSSTLAHPLSLSLTHSLTRSLAHSLSHSLSPMTPHKWGRGEGGLVRCPELPPAAVAAAAAAAAAAAGRARLEAPAQSTEFMPGLVSPARPGPVRSSRDDIER